MFQKSMESQLKDPSMLVPDLSKLSVSITACVTVCLVIVVVDTSATICQYIYQYSVLSQISCVHNSLQWYEY